jgi:hypothetical protein
MIDIAAGKSTPRILLDKNEKRYFIEGHSYPENSSIFYKPVIDWLKENLPSLKEFRLEIKLMYINTSSTKALMYVFDLMDEAYDEGTKISVNWYYDEENEMAKETGEEFKEELSLPFSIIKIPSND